MSKPVGRFACMFGDAGEPTHSNYDAHSASFSYADEHACSHGDAYACLLPGQRLVGHPLGPSWYDMDWYEPQTVSAKLTKNSVGIPDAQVYAMAHYADEDRRWPESGFVVTDDQGTATLSLPIKGGPGATV